jgi:hypothetical protein
VGASHTECAWAGKVKHTKNAGQGAWKWVCARMSTQPGCVEGVKHGGPAKGKHEGKLGLKDVDGFTTEFDCHGINQPAQVCVFAQLSVCEG